MGYVTYKTRNKTISFAATRKLSFILLACAAFYLIIRKSFSSTVCPSISQMIIDKFPMDNVCLVNYIKENRTKGPDLKPYNFSSNLKAVSRMESFARDRNSPWVVALIILEMLLPKRKRTFLECGALDGEIFSTTLHLERFLNWTGVLIEADPIHYNSILRKHRKAYAVKACVSTEPFAQMAKFQHVSELSLLSNTSDLVTVNFNPGTGHIIRNTTATAQNHFKSLNEFDVLCVPIYSILLALEMTSVDLFVLDIEGKEFNVIRTIPFDKVDIGAFLIEIIEPIEVWREYSDFFKSKGYTLYGGLKGGMHPTDGLFIKTEYFQPEKLATMDKREVYKIITGEKDASKISHRDIEVFKKHLSYACEFISFSF